MMPAAADVAGTAVQLDVELSFIVASVCSSESHLTQQRDFIGTVGWATGRASSLKKPAALIPKGSLSGTCGASKPGSPGNNHQNGVM